MVPQKLGQLEAALLASVERVFELVLEQAALWGPALSSEAAVVVVRSVLGFAPAAVAEDGSGRGHPSPL